MKEVNEAMWLDFDFWALGQDNFHQQLQAETGAIRPAAPKNALEALVDESTGVVTDYMKRFVIWITKTYWGFEYAPPLFFERFMEQDK